MVVFTTAAFPIRVTRGLSRGPALKCAKGKSARRRSSNATCDWTEDYVLIILPKIIPILVVLIAIAALLIVLSVSIVPNSTIAEQQ